MHPTHNTIPEQVRSQVVDLLNARLADVGDIYFQAKTAHWNVKGPNFRALHKIFDSVAEMAAESADQIAERLVQLGGQAKSSVQSVAAETSLEEYNIELVDEHDHITAVAAALAHFGTLLREGIEQTEDLDDMGTSDLLIDVVREVDKLLWFVEAHLGVEPAHVPNGRRSSRASSRR
jgi:starvation-inducible DNA-binding protein